MVGCGADSPDWCRNKEEFAASSCATYGPAVPGEWRSHHALNGPPRPKATLTRPPAETLRSGHCDLTSNNCDQAVKLNVRSTGSDGGECLKPHSATAESAVLPPPATAFNSKSDNSSFSCAVA